MRSTTISARERRLIAVAGLIAFGLVLFLLLRGGDEAPVELVATPGPQAAPPPPPPAMAQPAPAPDASGLRLHGLLASGAVIGFADGSQRLVRVGREALPGLTLARIEQRHAVLASAGGELRLGFDGAAQAGAAPAAAPAASAPAAERDEILRYRLGLAPRRADGRITGFTVRRGADLPALRQAGIRPGDTILRVNGSVLDEERMQELAWTIANSSRTEFEIERGGRRLRASLQGR